MKMEHSCVQLDELPDEILLIILKKLNNIAVLCSLIGVNKRLHQIVHDYILTSSLTLLEYWSHDHILSLPDPTLDRFCFQILPTIQHKIKWFNLESSSMERILLCGNYPNLSGLGIFNIEKKKALDLVRDQTSLSDIFRNQITSLTIGSINTEGLATEVNTLIFTNIFVMFPKLKYLNFNPSDRCRQEISFSDILSSIFPSTLLELHIKVFCIEDCILLLDDHFKQLRVFNVNIMSGFFSSISKMNEEKLLNLRDFSLCCSLKIRFYDALLVPLLRRMSNLERLALYFPCLREKSFTDGNDLKRNVLNHLPRLKRISFNISTIISTSNQTNFLTNEDVQHSFRQFPSKEIISCVDYFLDQNEGQCHAYSYPFKMSSYERITNNFPGGLFPCVRKVSLFDERPFEHQFFLRIQKSFPLMQRLTVTNWKGQRYKQFRRCNKYEQRDLSIIQYSHLTFLDLTEVHDDYVEQFLLQTKISLTNNLTLYANYKSLGKVTYNFKRDATRINCSKIHFMYIDEVSRVSKDFKSYFLSTEDF